MKYLRKVITTIESITTIIFFLLIIIISLQIGYRYLGFSLPWTEELARVNLIWYVFLGSVIALINRDHIRVEIIDIYLSVFAKKIYNIIIDLLTLIFVIFWGIGAYRIFLSNQNISLVTIDLSTGNAFYLPTFLVACLMIIVLMLRIIFESIDLKKGGR